MPFSLMQRTLIDRLRGNPSFAFDFARRFREVPAVRSDSITKLRAGSVGETDKLGSPTLALTADTLDPSAPGFVASTSGEPWPSRWGVLIESLDAFEPSMLLTWPLVHARVRQTLGVPVTHIALCSSPSLAEAVNRAFAIEPDLMPVVVASGGFDDLPLAIRQQLLFRKPTGSGLPN